MYILISIYKCIICREIRTETLLDLVEMKPGKVSFIYLR